ncbi:unnamed protein product [Victoria cruziana]
MQIRRLRADRPCGPPVGGRAVAYESLPRTVKMVELDYRPERPKHAVVSPPTGRKRQAEDEGQGGRPGYRLKAAKKGEENADRKEPDFFYSRMGAHRSLSFSCLWELWKPTSYLSPTEVEDDTLKSVKADSICRCDDGFHGHCEQGRPKGGEKKMYEKLFGRDECLARSEDEDDEGGCGRNGWKQERQGRAGRERCSELTTGAVEKFCMAEVGMGFETAGTGENGPETPYGSVAVCGRRREMEDAVAEVPGLFSDGPARFDFFAVYDGHGGSQVAGLCRDLMHRVLVEVMEERDRWCEVGVSQEEWWCRLMRSCFSRVDAEVGRMMVAPKDVGVSGMTSGSTALVALVGEHHIIVANCGDSRAVLARTGSAVPLSFDHKPERPAEMKRVEAAGGKIINCDGYRVLGVLATSRSIGDDYLKPYVISEPEVTIGNRTAEDEFLVLATDGLWDVMSNELVCRVARRCLSKGAKKRLPTADPSAGRTKSALAAATLAELALSRGSDDNISVLVVDLRLPSKR